MPHGQSALESPGITSAQVTPGSILISFGPKPELAKPLRVSYQTLRDLRLDPTIALARAVAIAPAVLGEWSVESRPDAKPEWVEFARQQFLPLRAAVMEAAISGGIDFGHQGFEKVFKVIEGGDFAGKVGIKKLKPLLQDLTAILVERDGSFAGFSQEGDIQQAVTVPLEISLLIPFRVEGTQWHGTSLLENARASVRWWVDCNDGAARYDRKLAGSHWVVHYPSGTTDVTTVEQGETTSLPENDNRSTAQAVLNALQSSGGVAVGKTVEGEEWKIELLSDGTGKQVSFVPRLQYLDAQKVRAMLLPERVVMEGRYGTRAEAETHTDTAVTVMQMSIETVTDHVSWHVLDQLMELNWGPEARGSVWLAAAPLENSQKEALRAIHDRFLANPATLMEEYEATDKVALRDQLGVPTLDVKDVEDQLRKIDVLPEDVIDGVSRMMSQIQR